VNRKYRLRDRFVRSDGCEHPAATPPPRRCDGSSTDGTRCCRHVRYRPACRSWQNARGRRPTRPWAGRRTIQPARATP